MNENKQENNVYRKSSLGCVMTPGLNFFNILFCPGIISLGSVGDENEQENNLKIEQ